MLNKFFQNTRKPQGFLGKMMLRGMNSGHAKMAKWGFSHLNLRDNVHILDVGCGGGANIAHMLKVLPKSKVDGVDYSEESVMFSQKTNSAQLGKRCAIYQGDVSALPYAEDTLDYVTAFETIYFWPDLGRAFKEIRRVLKPQGIFFICCESDDATDTTWTTRIEGMRIHPGDKLKEQLIQAGFKAVQVHRNEKGWMCLEAIC
ncbi:class I SAM-dependent methyltransferase [Lachnospiraceae bacterium OttesenSCG-928-D06]|nr:class I SAM-dependent methyltransferase [Lachnospiraceae bacterium OttesenSCG-928-D06]